MLLTSALIFTAVALSVFAIFAIFGERTVRQRLERLADGTSAAIDLGPEQGAPDAGTVDRFGRLLSRIGERFGFTRGEPGRLRLRLIEAGFRKRGASARFGGLQVLLAAGVPALTVLVPSIWSMGYDRGLAVLGVGCVIGFMLPSYLLDKRRESRKLEIGHGLPDSLDLMLVCVEAGLGLTAALTRVAREFARTNPVLASEFELVHLECRAGKSTTEALRAMADRTGVADLRSLVAMLVQTERFGTSLGGALRVHADSMRVKRLQIAEEAAQRAPVKMLFPAALLIFPATLMVTVGPGMIRLFEFFGEK